MLCGCHAHLVVGILASSQELRCKAGVSLTSGLQVSVNRRVCLCVCVCVCDTHIHTHTMCKEAAHANTSKRSRIRHDR